MHITTADLADKLSRMDILQSIPEPILLQLAARTRIDEFPAGGLVFRKNERGSSLFLILQGTVKIHDGDIILSHIHEGSCFGEIGLLDEAPRSMSVTATEPAVLARIDRDVFFDVFRNYPEVTTRIVGLLTRRLRFQTDQTLEHLHRREEELTRLVAERTAELMQQKEEAELLRQKAEAEKQEADRQRQRAEQSERAEQQFLANMSHEIRTPMNAVLGMTKLMLQKAPREDQLRYLHSILQSSEALLVILNDILDISKIQAGKLELEVTGMNIATVLETVRTTLQFRAEEKGLSLLLKTDPGIPPVLLGDPVRLQQVLVNLAGNAVKFTDTGQVTLIARLLDRSGSRCRLHFEVQDTGIGMTPAQLAVVFESFRQASGDTTRKYGGTGLGLSISKQLVERFGGTLEARSAPGKGSAFWFDIDLEIGEEKQISAPPPVKGAAGTLRGLRILLAEDNYFNRVVAEETLELLIPDVTVRCVENGQEALDRVQTEHFDVILMDVTMPVMDGLQATRAIRNLPLSINTVPIIAFTASVTNKEVQRCLKTGMNACVPKPFKDDELLQALLAVTNPGERQTSPDQPAAPENPEPVPAAGPAPAQLDFLEQLTGGNPARIRKYLGLFLESARDGLPRIEAALAAGDREELRRVVHTIKPQFRMVGMEELAQQAQVIETQVLEGTDPDSLPGNVSRLTAAIRESVLVFENYLKA